MLLTQQQAKTAVDIIFFSTYVCWLMLNCRSLQRIRSGATYVGSRRSHDRLSFAVLRSFCQHI